MRVEGQHREPGTVAARARRALGAGLETALPGVEYDEQGYVREVEQNLLPGIARAELEHEFGGGAGRELEGKMRAPWSSAALAVNSFAPWRRAPAQLVLAGLTGFTAALAFEAKCPNGVSSIPPHLDVLLGRGDEIVGVESKCTEFLGAKSKVKVSPRYLALATRGDERASSRWFAALSRVGEFRLLDAYQLVKHYLGLALQYKDRPLTLVYLYWEPANSEVEPVFATHRREIATFANLVAGDDSCRFASLSYRAHWEEVASADGRPGWLDAHIEQLRRRYLVAI